MKYILIGFFYIGPCFCLTDVSVSKKNRKFTEKSHRLLRLFFIFFIFPFRLVKLFWENLIFSIFNDCQNFVFDKKNQFVWNFLRKNLIVKKKVWE
jgi:hypothetical protein